MINISLQFSVSFSSMNRAREKKDKKHIFTSFLFISIFGFFVLLFCFSDSSNSSNFKRILKKNTTRVKKVTFEEKKRNENSFAVRDGNCGWRQGIFWKGIFSRKTTISWKIGVGNFKEKTPSWSPAIFLSPDLIAIYFYTFLLPIFKELI